MYVEDDNSIKLLWLGYDKAATLLIEKGAEVNAVGKYGKTALIHAAQKGKMKDTPLSNILPIKETTCNRIVKLIGVFVLHTCLTP